MLVTETKIADVGKYRCFVVTNGGECGTSTSLSVSGDGLFNLTSTLDRPPDSAFYTCVVNGIGGQEGEARYPPAEFGRG
ncbi:hypothetical protein CRUP_018057, partial [Coryphaenoides rupestris]